MLKTASLPTYQVHILVDTDASHHVVSCTLNPGLSRLLHTELHWPDVPQRVMYNCTCYSALQCSTASTVKRLRTLWNCANQSQMSHRRNISNPPPNSSWSYRTTSSAPMADGLSVWLVRQSGIPCRQLAGSGCWQEQFQTISEGVSICNILMHPAQ